MQLVFLMDRNCIEPFRWDSQNRRLGEAAMIDHNYKRELDTGIAVAVLDIGIAVVAVLDIGIAVAAVLDTGIVVAALDTGIVALGTPDDAADPV
jgi:hypothetical protein